MWYKKNIDIKKIQHDELENKCLISSQISIVKVLGSLSTLTDTLFVSKLVLGMRSDAPTVSRAKKVDFLDDVT